MMASTAKRALTPKKGKTAIEVVMKRNEKHSFLATIQTNGRDEYGREVAPNGIKWKL